MDRRALLDEMARGIRATERHIARRQFMWRLQKLTSRHCSRRLAAGLPQSPVYWPPPLKWPGE